MGWGKREREGGEFTGQYIVFSRTISSVHCWCANGIAANDRNCLLFFSVV